MNQLLKLKIIPLLFLFLLQGVGVSLGQSNIDDFAEFSDHQKIEWLNDNFNSINADNIHSYSPLIDYINKTSYQTQDSLLFSWEMLFKAQFYFLLDEPDSSIIYAESALQSEGEKEFDKLKMEANFLLAMTFFKDKKFDNALPFYMEALNLSERVNDLEKRGMSLCKIGEIRSWFLDIENALVYFQSAEEVMADHPDKRMLVFLYMKKASALSMIKRYHDAQFELRRAIELSEQNQYFVDLVNSHIQMGKILVEQDSVNYAIQHFNSAIDKSHELNNNLLIGESYLEFGEFWYKIKSFRKAEHYLEKSINFLESEKSEKSLAKAYLLFGQCKYIQKDYKNASKYLIKSIEFYDNVTPNYNLLQAYEMLSKVFYLSSEFEKAYHYLKISKIIGDSLNKIDNQKQVAELQIRYETENNKKRISTLTEVTKVYEDEKSKNKIYLYFLLIGFILVSILSIFLYTQFSLNKRNLVQFELQNEEIRKKNNELRSATSQAKESKVVQEQFIDSVGHELKTPLTSILGSLDVLERSSFEKEHQLMFENLKSSSENLLFVINELLDFSKIGKEGIELNLMQTDLQVLVKELAVKFGERANKKGVEFEFVNDQNFPQWAYIDAVKFRKVLNNILDNAIKFTHTGKIIFKTTIIEKHKTFNGARVKIEFCIKDTGIGISDEMKTSIFKSFAKDSGSAHKEYAGIGLGLTISKEFVKAMGGDIYFESKTGKGSEFKVILEIKSDKKAVVSLAENERKQSMARFNNEMGILYPLEILIAEDNDTNMAFIMTVLRKLGYDPIGVSNGQEALDILNERKFDIILMDIQMPVMDGITATKEIHKRFPKGQQPVVIAVTANAAGKNKLAYLEAGLDDYISKPFTSKVLEKLIVNWYKKIHLQS